jgi:chromosome segregation ATPase
MSKANTESLLPDYSERSRSGQPRPEPVIDPERVALENDVRLRDSTINKLEEEYGNHRKAFDTLENKYEEAKLSEMKENLFFQVENDRLSKKNNFTTARVKALQEDMKDTSSSLEYATLIVEPPKDTTDKKQAANYVMKLQKQVIETVEKMQGMPKQLSELVENFDEGVTKLRTQLMEIVEDRSRTEVSLRKQMSILNDEIHEMEASYRERIQDSEEKLKLLRAKWDKKQTFEDIEEELEEADAKLEEMQELHEKQEIKIKKLEATAAKKRG